MARQLFTTTNPIASELLQQHLVQDQKLLDEIKVRLPQLEKWQSDIVYDYEDRMYRFYYQSFKVYWLQEHTLEAVELFRDIGRDVDKKLCKWFEEILAEGTGKEFEIEHNDKWLFHTRPIVEAFLHTKYFVEMMIKCAREMEAAESLLPSGWAAILVLYGQR